MASITNKQSKKRSLSEGDISNPPAKRVTFNPKVKTILKDTKVDKSSRSIVIIDETGKQATISATKKYRLFWNPVRHTLTAIPTQS